MVGVVQISAGEVKAMRDMSILEVKVEGRGDKSSVMSVWRDWSPKVAF